MGNTFDLSNTHISTNFYDWISYPGILAKKEKESYLTIPKDSHLPLSFESVHSFESVPVF